MMMLHTAYASEMLYAAIIGAVPSSDPEIRGFAKGFSLLC